MTQASQEPMLQTDCALATKQKMRDGSVERMQERPPADWCDREWTVKCSRPDRERSRSGQHKTVGNNPQDM